jgi:hypothetical protein
MQKGEQPTPRYLEFLDFRARTIAETFAFGATR